MPRTKCEAYKVFEKNLERSKAFLRIFQGPSGRGPGQPSNDEKELLRGAVVFAVGALDAFLHDLVMEVVPTFGGKKEALTEALRAITKEDPALALRVALEEKVDERRNEFRQALDSWLSKKTFQGAEAVVRAIGYVGLELSWADIDTTTQINSAAELERYTLMRHEIVHRGRRPFVRRDSAQKCINLVETIGKSINSKAVEFYN